MLLPAKFQTSTPAPLGAKVVAIAPAPKPHVHQWLAVPDSKIHSRCAECGTVTLTEIVAPKVSFCPDTGHVAARLAAGAGQWVVGVDPAAPGSDRTVFSEHFLGKPYSFVDLLRAPGQAPALRHYTSITAPDGKVRMVETDAEGWIKNDGTRPVADDVRVEVQTDMGNCMTFNARTFVWECISRWRPAA